MKKVGDKVKIKSLQWYEENCDYYGRVNVPYTFVTSMSVNCGKEAVIKRVVVDQDLGGVYYWLDCDNMYKYSQEMFEDNLSDIRRKKLLKINEI